MRTSKSKLGNPAKLGGEHDLRMYQFMRTANVSFGAIRATTSLALEYYLPELSDSWDHDQGTIGTKSRSDREW